MRNCSSPASDAHIQIAMSGGIAETREGFAQVFAIANPQKRNALTPVMRRDLAAGIERAYADDAVRVVILRGDGNHFCAGADISNLAGTDRPSAVQLRERVREAQHLVRVIATGSKPVIAAVEGAAFGAGFSIAVACDLIVAADSAKFGANFTNLGITAEFGLFATLPRRVGHQAARRIIYLAQQMSGGEAVAAGLADKLAVSGAALETALEIGASLAVVPPLAMAATKRGFAAGIDTIEDALQFELDVMPALAMSEDFREAVAAFKEKRSPRFIGR